MSSLLEFNSVNFSYGERHVLNNVRLVVHEGTCAALIGANGAGKTTLLCLAAGALMATSGEILLEGQTLSTMSRRERSCLVALVPQRLDVPFDFTVQQIVEQGRTPHLGFLRGPLRDDHLAIDRALELTDTSRLRIASSINSAEASANGSKSLSASHRKPGCCYLMSPLRTSILADRLNSSICYIISERRASPSLPRCMIFI